jgi:diacylglycerol O-acyltransferase/trehalose O-mycolyltransferase
VPRQVRHPAPLTLLSERWITERQCELVVHSAAIGQAGQVRVLLPPTAAAVRRPPLLMLLHGADDGPASWETGVGIAARCEDLDAVVVMPTGGVVGFCTDWVERERPVTGRVGSTWAARVAPAWERFHLEEVLPWVTERFGASDRRVVLGVSMGGHGALAYAARHPGVFAAAASFSGVLHSLGPGIPSLIAGTLLRERQHRHALWGSPVTRRLHWQAHNPHDLAEQLRGLAVYISRGDGIAQPGDPASPALAGALERLIGTCTDAMALRLSQLGIAATVSHGHGVHMWPTWNREMDVVWPFLLEGLGLA